MPSKFVGGVARVIFWRYQRGSWQYDVLCGLILAFIFLTPQTVFDGRAFNEDEGPAKVGEQRVSINPQLENMAEAG